MTAVLLESGEELRWKLLEARPPLREADIVRVRAIDGAMAGLERGGAVLRPDRGVGRLIAARYWSAVLDLLEILRRVRHPVTPSLFQGRPGDLLAGVRDKYDTALEAAQYAAAATGQLTDLERVIVEEHVPPGGRILDVGCGGGREAVGFARLGYRVVAIDIAPRMIEAARQSAARLGVAVDFRVESVTNVSPSLGSFDGVFFGGSLHHVPGRAVRITTLARLAQVLTASGVLIVMVHYRDPRSLLSRSRLVDGTRRLLRAAGARNVSEPGDGYMREVSEGSDPRHACFFHHYDGPSEVRAELRAAGFAGDEVSRGWWVCHQARGLC